MMFSLLLLIGRTTLLKYLNEWEIRQKVIENKAVCTYNYFKGVFSTRIFYKKPD
jgi:hypothetical protein